MYSYVARQPILDNNQQLVAYELLFRDGDSNYFPNINPDQATSNILTNNHLTMGVEQVTGDLPAYINFHADTLIRHFPSFLDPKKIVIEILEDVPISDELLAACKSLKEQGYVLALDDHDFDPKWDVFLPYIDIIKVDVLSISILEVSRYVNRIKPYNKTLLAEKVETAQQFEQLKMLGFSLFQGYFFAKPEMLKQKKITTTKHNILELINQASKISLDFDHISDIFSSDPGLTYKLLRFINSPTYGRSQQITSLKHALVYIGEVELKKFIALLALSDLAEDKASELMRISLFRARFCEQIGQLLKDSDNPPKAFLTGLLSMIDGILDHDIQSVVEILPIDQDIKSALLGEAIYLTNYLDLAKHFEQGQWLHSESIAQQFGLDMEKCSAAHIEAMSWADSMLSC
ncbi:EAL and HDOD domain-containing protein [Thalassotalea euphylliae]|uniref:HDOD domain-containing protein n=1 Tax=Thalassotalea euphylliae TaxID=1655234 RepID=A0A3E0UJW7_9GAMM|nr:HDOD domain-containing protein [Thalassotalea euphylliae]REL37199.1 HDOD domain-containing protein [Thalassotalea euphylliae]